MASNRAYNVERKNNSFRYNKFGYKRRTGDHASCSYLFFSPSPQITQELVNYVVPEHPMKAGRGRWMCSTTHS